MPPITDPDDMELEDEDVVRNIQVNIRLYDGWEELLQGTEAEIDKTRERLYELEARLQNGEQLRREIEIKQRKYCGLNQIFCSGTLEEQKMLLAIVVKRIEVRQDYELNIQLSPDFERFLDGLIEMR